MGERVEWAKKPFHFVTGIELFPIGVMVSVGESKADMLRHLKRYGCRHDRCMKAWNWEPTLFERGHSAIFECNRSVLWLANEMTTIENHGTIAHECFHIVHMGLKQSGVRFCEASEEAFAYAIGALVMEVTHGLITRRNRKKR